MKTRTNRAARQAIEAHIAKANSLIDMISPCLSLPESDEDFTSWAKVGDMDRIVCSLTAAAFAAGVIDEQQAKEISGEVY